MSGVSSAAPSPFASVKSRIQTSSCFGNSSRLVIHCLPHDHCLYTSDLKLKGIRIGRDGGSLRATIQCNSNTGPGGPNSGETENRGVLDAFFLGKALAEALNERIESTVGEFLSTIGRLQAEQQKQVQDFQEDVLERAKRAKEKAAREAMEAQALVPKSVSENSSIVASKPATEEVAPSSQPSIVNPDDKESPVGVTDDD